MSKSTGLDAEASELRQRQSKGPSNVARQPPASTVDSQDTRNGSDHDKMKPNSKTYGRTPDGTGK